MGIVVTVRPENATLFTDNVARDEKQNVRFSTVTVENSTEYSLFAVNRVYNHRALSIPKIISLAK